MPQLPSFLTRLSPFSPPSTAGDTPVAAAQGPAAKSVREAQQSPEFETARRCVAADWWPHGLGLHVDEGELRHEFEPREGARTWIQVERRPKGWSSEGTESTQLTGFAALTHGSAFDRNLIQELLLHVGGLDLAGLKRPPRRSRPRPRSDSAPCCCNASTGHARSRSSRHRSRPWPRPCPSRP